MCKKLRAETAKIETTNTEKGFITWINRKKLFSRWIFPLLVGLAFAFGVPLIASISQKTNINLDFGAILAKILLAYVLLDLPQILLEEVSKLSVNISKEMGRMGDLPRFSAFHTDQGVLEEKMAVLDDKLTKSSHKWIYSKYISKLLSFSFRDFKIQFDSGEKGTQEYSRFSSEIMKECTESVFLTGSMTPYEWLSYLAVNEDAEKAFFNNTGKHLEFDPDNHSIVLGNLQIPIKRRAVCLEEFDYNHLFLSERSLKEYYWINSGIKTTFCSWTKGFSERYPQMCPLEYEYAWYDRALLFKFEKRANILEILRENEGEYNSVKAFFEDVEKGIGSHTREKTLLNNVQTQKESLLASIKNVGNQNWQIPHKYAYLLEDWMNFLKSSRTFNDSAKVQSTILFQSFLKELSTDDSFEMVEIGSGLGDKSLSLCECILAEKIKSYNLLDICRPMLDDAYSLLFQNPKLKGKVTSDRYDCCDPRSVPVEYYKDKTVLILNNSTIFSEDCFPWHSLQSSKRIFITLHVLDEGKNDAVFNDYLGAHYLFLAPLKIYDIPFTSKFLSASPEDIKRYFGNNGAHYSNNDPFYKITFNLKKYLEDLDQDVKSLYLDTRKGERKQKTRGLFNSNRDELDNEEQVVVLSSLKFRTDDSDWQEKAINYFYNKLNDSNKTTWDISIKSAGSFIGIWIVRKLETNGIQSK